MLSLLLAFARFASTFFASFSAASGRKVTMAFTFGFTRSTWAMKAFITSTVESLRVRRRRASLRAGWKTMSFMVRLDRSNRAPLSLGSRGRG